MNIPYIQQFRDVCLLAGLNVSDNFVNWLDQNGYFEQPASRFYHNAFKGGLFVHSRTVAENLCKLTKQLNLKWISYNYVSSCYKVGLFHDICKMGMYKFENGEIKHNENYTCKGHADLSLKLLEPWQEEISLNEEEMECIMWHMGAYAAPDGFVLHENNTNIKYGPEWWHDLSASMRKYPNVFFTHVADMMDAYGYHI